MTKTSQIYMLALPYIPKKVVLFPYTIMNSSHLQNAGCNVWNDSHKFPPPCVTNIEFGKAHEVEDITKMVKGIVSYELMLL